MDLNTVNELVNSGAKVTWHTCFVDYADGDNKDFDFKDYDKVLDYLMTNIISGDYEIYTLDLYSKEPKKREVRLDHFVLEPSTAYAGPEDYTDVDLFIGECLGIYDYDAHVCNYVEDIKNWLLAHYKNLK